MANNPSYSPWAYDKAFGIVHHHECWICHQYITHLSNVSESDISYPHAVDDRKAELHYHFLEGFRQGQDSQQKQNDELIKASCSERESAYDLLSLSELRLQKAREEIRQLCHELLAFRAEDDEVHPQMPPGESSWVGGGVPHILNDSFNSDKSDDSLAASGDTESSVDNESEEDHSPSWACMELDDDEGKVEDEMDRSSYWRSNSVRALHKPFPGTLTIKTRKAAHLSHLSVRDVRIDTKKKPGPNANVGIRFTPYPPKQPRRLPDIPNVHHRRSQRDALENIREKMELARQPDNGHILTHVKLLISKAHKTPAKRRTEVQKVLLSEWRRPRAPILVQDPPVSTYSSDVYVDASQAGIGFIFKGQWQAWELESGWKTRSREIQWAEAVAVELGLRLMIQAGYSGRTLRLRSDNFDVVGAISKRFFQQHQIGEIVQHIDDLCWAYDITLEIEWIAGKDNPADAPSRLRTETDTPRFPHSIDIPSHLRKFVLPYKPEICGCSICLRSRRMPGNYKATLVR